MSDTKEIKEDTKDVKRFLSYNEWEDQQRTQWRGWGFGEEDKDDD